MVICLNINHTVGGTIMKLDISTLEVFGYIKYINTKNRMKYYLCSYKKNINDIDIDIEVFKSIKGGILFKVGYSYRGINIYGFNIKEGYVNMIEDISSIMKDTLDKIITDHKGRGDLFFA